MTDKKKVGDINITMGDGNTIGHIGHKIYAPTPTLVEADERNIIAHDDGTSTITIVIDAPDAVGRARFFATGSDVLSMAIMQAPKAGMGVYMSSKQNVFRRRIENGFEEAFGPLHGKYVVNIRARDPSNVDVGWEILPP
ncbi:MAG: hypothetical protein DCF16_01940 [Alphaproteobacteria bacterium]|nr:MAG: hypothetical protein DCF16_01940 [Alphaproteobacteria bacterium]